MFALGNLGFLTLRYLSGALGERVSENRGINPAFFSALAPDRADCWSGTALCAGKRCGCGPAGIVVGWAAVLVGLTGVILHLDSTFFYERTIREPDLLGAFCRARWLTPGWGFC